MAEIRFTREDVTGVGDAAAAGTDAEASGVEPPPPSPSDAAGDAPTASDERAAEAGAGRPEIAVFGAFVGAFVAAKVLGRLTGGGRD